MHRLLRATLTVTLAATLCQAAAASPAGELTQRALYSIYKELVEINATNSVGDSTVAAKAMAKRLMDAGLPAADVQVLVHPGNAHKGNLVARLRGDGSAKPVCRRGEGLCRVREGALCLLPDGP